MLRKNFPGRKNARRERALVNLNNALKRRQSQKNVTDEQREKCERSCKQLVKAIFNTQLKLKAS